jgi:hypothetical protein
MIRRTLSVLIAMTAAVTMLYADFSYQQTTTITGGMMASMMKVVGVFSKSAREPVRVTVALKGDKMAHRSANDSTVIDLNAQTITHIDFQKKTYSVMTFDEMKQALDQMAKRMETQKETQKEKQKETQKEKEGGPQTEFKVSVNSTGNTRQIAGYEAKEAILKMEMQATDEKSGQQGSMTITSDMWLVPGVAGYDQIRDFYRRMAEKIDWTPAGNMFMSQPGVAKGMAGLSKEMAKLDGVPVLQIMTMGLAGQPGADASGGQASAPQQQQAERPSLAGALGGLGGRFGLGKKKSEPKQDAPPAQAENSGAPGSLLETKTEMTDFSTNPVDDSQFAVPAGFKKVDSDLTKAGR